MGKYPFLGESPNPNILARGARRGFKETFWKPFENGSPCWQTILCCKQPLVSQPRLTGVTLHAFRLAWWVTRDERPTYDTHPAPSPRGTKSVLNYRFNFTSHPFVVRTHPKHGVATHSAVVPSSSSTPPPLYLPSRLDAASAASKLEMPTFGKQSALESLAGENFGGALRV